MNNHKEIVDILLDELTKRKLIKNNNCNDSYERTKQLLKDCIRIKKSKDNIEFQIKKLEKAKNSNDLKIPTGTDYSIDIKGFNVTSNLDSINNRIMCLKEDIKIIDCFFDYVNNILKDLNKKDYVLFDKLYIQGINIIDLSLEMNVDVSTIYRRVNKIIRESLKIEMFPVAYLNENN